MYLALPGELLPLGSFSCEEGPLLVGIARLGEVYLPFILIYHCPANRYDTEMGQMSSRLSGRDIFTTDLPSIRIEITSGSQPLHSIAAVGFPVAMV